MEWVLKIIEMFFTSGGLVGGIIGLLLIALIYLLYKQNKDISNNAKTQTDVIASSIKELGENLKEFAKDIRDNTIENVKITSEINNLDTKIDKIDTKLDSLNEKIEIVNQRTLYCPNINKLLNNRGVDSNAT